MVVETGRKFHTLDGMRGVAALSVVPIHSPDFFQAHYRASGHLAVDFFFLLSGFVVAHAYERRLLSSLSLRAFIKIRLIRLYPLYIAGSAIGLVVIGLSILKHTAAVDLEHLPFVVLAAVVFVPLPPLARNSDPYPLDGPAWSLVLEILVNFFYSLLLPWLSNRVLAVVVGLSAIALVAVSMHFGTLHVGWKWENAIAGIPRVTFSFFLGVLCFRNVHIKTHINYVPFFLLVGLAAALAVQPQGNIRPYYELVLVLAVFPALLVAGSKSEPGPKMAKLCTFFGLTSYAVYILHAPLYVLTHGLLRLFQSDVAALAPYVGLAFLAMLLTIAWLVDKVYDQPVRHTLSRRLRLRTH